MSPTAEELLEDNIADLFPHPSTHLTTSPSLLKETPSSAKKAENKETKKEKKKEKKGKKQPEVDVGVQNSELAALKLIICQGFVKMNAKLETLNGKVEALNVKVEALNGKVKNLNDKVEALNGKVEPLNGKFDALNATVETLTADNLVLKDKNTKMMRVLYDTNDAVKGLQVKYTVVYRDSQSSPNILPDPTDDSLEAEPPVSQPEPHATDVSTL